MAMHAGEIAKLADVNLQDLGLGAAQLKAFGSQSVRKPVHGWKDFETQ